MGLTPERCGEFTPNVTALLITPFCRIRALPEVAPGATVAPTWVSLQFCTTPFKVPNHTWPVPCAAPKLESHRVGGTSSTLVWQPDPETPAQAGARAKQQAEHPRLMIEGLLTDPGPESEMHR